MNSENKHGNRARPWRWVVYCLIGLLIASSYVACSRILSLAATYFLFGFQPPEMALAQHTPKDVVGDLGGMKVRIPRHCAEYVEYDGDPGFGEKRKGPPPERTFDSKLRSFGIDIRMTDMKCQESSELRENRRQQFLKQESPWISIGVNAGSIYPKLGAMAIDRQARIVIDSIAKPTEFWFSNYERLPGKAHELDAYVVTGLNPNTGRPAKDTEKDVYIHFTPSGLADTYISCSKPRVPRGISTCEMSFSLEPKAKVLTNVTFHKYHLSKWREIREKTINLLTGFEVRETSADQTLPQNSSLNP
jgi:hypothetical protein